MNIPVPRLLPARPALVAVLRGLGLKDALAPSLFKIFDLAGRLRPGPTAPKLFHDLRRVARPSPTRRPAGPRVLILSFRSAWLPHATWEALIGEALRRRGADPTVFLCSGGLPAVLPGRAPSCGIANYHDARGADCDSCLHCGSRIAAALRLPVVRLDEFLDPAALHPQLAAMDELSVEQIRGLELDGLALGPDIVRAARWFLLVSDIEADRDGLAVLRSFAKAAVLLVAAAPRLLDRVRPEVVFLLNGLFLTESIVRSFALRRGIRVVSYEHGQTPDSLCFSEGFANYYRDLGDLWSSAEHQALTPAQEARLDTYLGARKKMWPGQTADLEAIRERLSLAPDRPLAVLFTNVTWDSASQDRDRGFASMFAWIVETIRLFASLKEAQLVVRVHPSEVDFPGWETRDPLVPRLNAVFPTLPANVRLVAPESPVSSYGLIQLARCGLLYTSTVGLEMAMEGKPVVVAGAVHYAGKGFTRDPSGPADYKTLVEAALDLSPDPEIRARARRYGFAFFFRNFHPFPLVAENAPAYVPSLNVRDAAALDPGAETSLDFICERILAGGPFFTPLDAVR